MTKKVRRVRQAGQNNKKDTVAQNKNQKTPAHVSEEDLRVEYTYVIRDLRRVAVLAAAMFILLIALNLVIQ